MVKWWLDSSSALTMCWRSAAALLLLVAPAASLAPPGSTLVLGGGFAGLYTALNLASDGRPVTVVDARDKFGFLPLLYEYAVGIAGEEEVSAPFAELFAGAPSVDFVRGDVASVDLEARAATLADGSVLAGEALVVALGKEPVLDAVPGVEAHAMPFYRLEDAAALRAVLKGFGADQKSVAVVGGGYTGVELACHLRAARPGDAVTLLDRGDTLVPSATAANREAAVAALKASGVSVRLGAAVDAVGPGELVVDGAAAPADCVVWTGGARHGAALRGVARKHRKRGLGGALATDAGFAVRGAPGCFALGDCAAVAGVANAPSAQMALQQAHVAARNVRAHLDGRPTVVPFAYADLGEMLSFADDNAAASAFPALSDALNVAGPVASLARRVVYAARMPTRAQRLTALSSLARSKAAA